MQFWYENAYFKVYDYYFSKCISQTDITEFFSIKSRNFRDFHMQKRNPLPKRTANKANTNSLLKPDTQYPLRYHTIPRIYKHINTINAYKYLHLNERTCSWRNCAATGYSLDQFLLQRVNNCSVAGKIRHFQKPISQRTEPESRFRLFAPSE